MLGDCVEPSVEVRAFWEGRLVFSEASERCSDPAPVYGLEFPEALDMYRVAQLHGFSDPREAVMFCRAERRLEEEARLLAGRSDEPEYPDY